MAVSEKNKKLISRLLIFFLGIPLVVFLILYATWRQHLIVNLILVVINLMASLELRDILSKKLQVPSRIQTSVITLILPLAMVLNVSFDLGLQAFILLGLALLSFLFLKGIFDRNFDGTSIEILASSLIVLVYPGMFSIWIMKIADLPYSQFVFIVFVLSVFANDSLAWAFGMLFGKGNRGIFKVSPNKSLAGFAGGLLAAISISVLAVIILPKLGIQAFANSKLPRIPAAIILGLATGLATIAGDLIESAIKRSTEVKDSGTIMQGRGGMLDSIDSLVFAAPVFWILYSVLFT